MTAFPVNTNISSLIAQRNLARVGAALGQSFERLSTGSRINRGADDPAGLIASEALRGRLQELEAESRSLDRTDSVARVADGALAEVSSLLNEANGAAVALANTAGLSQAERDAYQLQIDSARQGVDRITSTTTFNGQRVLDGSLTLSGAGASVDVARVSLDGSSQEAIAAALSQAAILRGQIGAFQSNGLQPALRSNRVEGENTAAAFSVIRDTDFASETAALALSGVLYDSTARALGLSNQRARGALDLLG